VVQEEFAGSECGETLAQWAFAIACSASASSAL